MPGIAVPRSQPVKRARLTDEPDALTLLKLDHRVVAELFDRYEAAGEDREKKATVAQRLCQELTVHAMLEEEIFYPKVREALEGDDDAEHLLNEAESDHEAIANLVDEIREEIEGDGASDATDAHIKTLAESVVHHVEEEEGELFPLVKRSELDLHALGAEMAARKEELEEEV
jgi:hemerythrin superfamily protein